MHSEDDPTIQQFSAMAAEWWAPDGPCRPLHDLNPTRLQYILMHTPLAGKRVLDVGCGGGILTESLAREGAQVTGIDASAALIQVAQDHAQAHHLAIDYQCITAEALSTATLPPFDVVICFELLEHVADPESLVATLARLVHPQGAVFFSTLHRTPQAFLHAIVGAEYLLRLLPRGTHHYRDFIRPSELVRWSKQAGLHCRDLRGLRYHPWQRSATLTQNVSVNYLIYATPEAS